MRSAIITGIRQKAWSGEELREDSISFEEVATIRPDGAQNIFHARVEQKNVEWPEEYGKDFTFCGPMWNGVEGSIFWQIVILKTLEIKEKLLAIGENLKKKYQAEFEQLKAPYVTAELAAVPKHLQKMKEYELQFLFHSDGLFLWYCMRELVNNGKLKLPTEQQRKVLSTLIIEK